MRAMRRIGSVVWSLAMVGALALSASPLMGGCGSKGDDGAAGAPGPPGAPPTTNTNLTADQDLPGTVIDITGVAGGSGAGGTFQAGDTLSVSFTVKKNDGTSLPINELDAGYILVSGPSFNYQRVLARQSDLRTRSVLNADGSYTYAFESPIPATYLAPLNDTAAFSAGELTGQPLLAGTYTVGMFAWKNYTVSGVTYRDAGDATKDFLLGGATSPDAREVVLNTNCNRCHEELRAHGGSRKSTRLCVLCHTAGSEDSEDPLVTPGVTIEFKIMIHKIHNGEHLPSVLGVATNSDGSRNYAATPAAYVIDHDGELQNYSSVGFPVWPNMSSPMPRDQGYTPLSTTQKGLEDEIRRGVTACDKCHGDPDGSDPLAAPAQGNLAYAQPSRRACGACHDDISWSYPYTSNGQTMPAQANDSACALCHVGTGNNLDTVNAHLHPLKNTSLNPGINVALTAATPSAGSTLDPGERLAVTFSVKDDSGADVQPAGLGLNAVVSGPNSNRNLILYSAIPTAALGAVAPSYTMNLPERVALELIGVATAGADAFTTARAPHWNVTGDLTSVSEATVTATATTLSAASGALRNFVDVASNSGFADGDYLVIDRGQSTEEYLRVRRVDSNRLWFSTRYDTSTAYQPYLRFAHSSGATVERVTLTTVSASNYTLNSATGEITEGGAGFTTGLAILCTYTTDFVMPSVYPPALNDSPDLDETWGKWTGKSIADGTYTVGVWATYSWNYALYGETNSYRTTSLPATQDILVGSASILVPYSLISSGQNCNACHNEILFHGGSRRNAETCLLCHATAGSEDWPIYRSPFPADPTPGVTINFRTMLHKIHMGEHLTNASTYVVNGFNGNPTMFEEIVFPAMPGGVKHCNKCHGTSTAWKEPANRDHPTEQGLPVRAWRAVCGSCHDSSAAGAHINLMTDASGAESCAVCHGQNREFRVELMHKNR